MNLPTGLFFPMLSSRPELPFEVESCQHLNATHEFGFDSKPWGRPREVAVLQYTFSGSGRLQFQDTDLPQNAGDAFLIHTNPKHRYFLPEDSSNWHFVSFTFRGPAMVAWAKAMARQHGISFKLNPGSAVLRAIESLFQRISREVMADPFAISSEIYQLMMLLEKELSPDTQGQPAHPKIKEAITYIHRHYRDKLSLDDIAQHCGFSRFYLTRLFKEETGSTVRDYLEQVRIQHAHHLLLDPERSIADVAAWVGFAEQAYFANVFRRRVGQSPSAYRIKAWQKQFPHSLPPSP